MDPSTNPAINGAQHANGQQYGLLDGIQTFAGNDTLQNGEDLSRFFDPELFDSTTIGNGFSQPSMSVSQDFDQNAGQQSSTPDIHHYNVPQQSYTHHQYSQPFYNSQQMSQSNYDPRFYSRPSASPVGFDGGYPFQSQMGYNHQHFNPQQMNLPQRQTPTPTQNYSPRQQQPTSFINIASRPSQLSHVQVRALDYCHCLTTQNFSNTDFRALIRCALGVSKLNRNSSLTDLWIPQCCLAIK